MRVRRTIAAVLIIIGSLTGAILSTGVGHASATESAIGIWHP